MGIYTSAATWSGITHAGVVCSMLLRNIIFARFLSPIDFATALTFGLILSLFEYISNFGHENLMQRSNSGDQRSFQATMHSAMILRGTIVALIIVLVSPLIPALLNLQNNEFNYALLAIVPFINGFAHLDHQRLHRRQIYTVTAKIGLTADILSVFVALTCVLIWDNYWAFYVSFLFRHSTSTLLSHLWARRPYALALETEHLKSLISFGLPLLIVGVLKYIGIEADKTIVAHVAGLETFAAYVLTLMLVVNGTNLVSLALSKIFIRRVSIAGDHIVETVKSNGIIYCYLILPLIFILGIIGEDLNLLIFGQQYTRVPFLIFTVCAVVGLRSLNQWLNQTVIGSAPTTLMLIADVVRVCTAVIGISLVYASNDVIKIAASFGFAELMYYITLSVLLNRRFSILKVSLLIFAIYATSIAALFELYAISYQSSQTVKLGYTLTALTLFYLTFLTISSTCRKQTVELLRFFSQYIRPT
jgi:O-antigen/teichoic acid export membrane protein